MICMMNANRLSTQTKLDSQKRTATCIQWIISSIWFDLVSVYIHVLCAVHERNAEHTKSIPKSTFFHISLPIHIKFNLYSNIPLIPMLWNLLMWNNIFIWNIRLHAYNIRLASSIKTGNPFKFPCRWIVFWIRFHFII